MTETYFALGIEIPPADDDLTSTEDEYRFRYLMGHLIGVGSGLNKEKVSRTVIAPEGFIRKARMQLGFDTIDEITGISHNLGEIRHEIPSSFSVARYGESESGLSASDFYKIKIGGTEGNPKIVVACLDLEHLLMQSNTKSNPDHLNEVVRMLKENKVRIITYSDLKEL